MNHIKVSRIRASATGIELLFHLSDDTSPLFTFSLYILVIFLKSSYYIIFYWYITSSYCCSIPNLL